MLAVQTEKRDNKARKKFIYDEFSRRLNEACDAAGLPGFRNGRQSTIAREMQVTPEAARRWFSGESVPRIEVVHRLAQYLRVDPSWLGAVDSKEATPEPKARAQAGAAEGVSLIVAGWMQAHGAAVSFDTAGLVGVDFVAIKRGRRYQVNVVAITEGQARFARGYDEVVNIAVVAPDMVAYEIPHEVIDAGRLHNTHRIVEVRRDGAETLFNGQRLAPLDYAKF